MRQTKYRGQHIETKEWVYGDGIVWVGDDYCAIPQTKNVTSKDYQITLIKILPESAGQSIGLQDKNGKDIYEGDIISHQRHDKPYSKKKKVATAVCVVEWDTGNHADAGLNPSKLVNPSLFNTQPGFRGKLISGPDWGYDWSEFHNCEIIGNIYENEGLLTTTKQ